MGRQSSRRSTEDVEVTWREAGPRDGPPVTAEETKKRCCCLIPCILLLFLATAVGVGVVVWKVLPEEQKDVIRDQTGADDLPDLPDIPNLPDIPGVSSKPAAPITFNASQFCNDPSECCNGLEELCDLGLRDVMFASMHNAAASEEDGFILNSNHEYRLESALIAGYRGINLDVAVCDGQLKLIHGKCSLGSRAPLEVFSNILDFLTDNPREVIILPIELVEIDGVKAELDDIYAIMQAINGFTEQMYWYNDWNDPWPTMRELIDANTRLLVFFYHGPSCQEENACPPGFQEWFLYTGESDWAFKSPDEIRNTTHSCPITRGYGGFMDFLALNVFVTNIVSSESAAEIVNSMDFLENHISECETMHGQVINVVFVDFWSKGDLVQVTQRINKARGERRRLQQGYHEAPRQRQATWLRWPWSS